MRSSASVVMVSFCELLAQLRLPYILWFDAVQSENLTGQMVKLKPVSGKPPVFNFQHTSIYWHGPTVMCDSPP
jgi:hypothetical protein